MSHFIPFIGVFPSATNQESSPGKIMAGDTALNIDGTGPRHRFPHAQALDLAVREPRRFGWINPVKLNSMKFH